MYLQIAGGVDLVVFKGSVEGAALRTKSRGYPIARGGGAGHWLRPWAGALPLMDGEGEAPLLALL
jgi:hypothetical protein